MNEIDTLLKLVCTSHYGYEGAEV